jgi:hypothetical protein
LLRTYVSKELAIQCNNVIEAAVNLVVFVGDGEHERGWRRGRSRSKRWCRRREPLRIASMPQQVRRAV